MRPEMSRRYITSTWAGKVTEKMVSLQSLLDSSRQNIRDAYAEERGLRALYETLQPGDPRLVGTVADPPLAMKIRAAEDDQAHFKEYVQYYEARVAADGGDKLISIGIVGPRKPEDEWRLP